MPIIIFQSPPVPRHPPQPVISSSHYKLWQRKRMQVKLGHKEAGQGDTVFLEGKRWSSRKEYKHTRLG